MTAASSPGAREPHSEGQKEHMRTKFIARRASGIVAAAAVVALAMTGCTTTSSAPDTKPETSPAASAYDADLFAMLPKDIQESKTIKVANGFATAMVFKDGADLTGPVPDIAKALEPILGVTFEWTEAPFPTLIPGLQAGKWDVAWGSVDDTKERQAVITFVDYVKGFSQLFVLKDNPQKIKNLESLCGLRASTLPGSQQLIGLQDASKACTDAGKEPVALTTFADLPSGLLALRSAKTDTFFATYAAAVHNLQAGGQSDLFSAVGPLYDPALSGLGVSLDSGKLAQAMQGALKKIVANGEYKKILTKYGYEKTALTPDEVTINGATK
jgi:polar amino acid transport system substrate-binding protein